MRELKASGLILEPQVAAHASELYAILKDPDLYIFIDDKEPVSEAALRDRFGRLETRLSGDGTEHWLNWVVRNSDGAAVGYVQATVTPDHTGEIAYVLGREHWRKGYAFAACAAMIAELGAAYGVTRLIATLDPANAASLALLRKLGFGLVEEMPELNEVRYARILTEGS